MVHNDSDSSYLIKILRSSSQLAFAEVNEVESIYVIEMPATQWNVIMGYMTEMFCCLLLASMERNNINIFSDDVLIKQAVVMTRFITIAEYSNTSSIQCTRLLKLILYPLSVNQVIKLDNFVWETCVCVSATCEWNLSYRYRWEISTFTFSNSTCTCPLPEGSGMHRSSENLLVLTGSFTSWNFSLGLSSRAMHCLVLKTEPLVYLMLCRNTT